MLISYLFAFLCLFAALSLVRRTIPAVYTFSIRLIRLIPGLVLWILNGSTSWPSSQNRTRPHTAQRFVPKRSKRP